MPDERDQKAAAARPGLEDEGAHLRREGPTLGRHRVPPRTLAEALYYPGAEDVEFDPPRADEWYRCTVYLDEEVDRTDRLVITTRDECEQAYAEIAQLERAGAAPGTPEGERLEDLIVAVEAFETALPGYSG